MATVQTIFQHPLFTPLAVTVAAILLLPATALYLSLVERKILADFQVRLGPMRVGPHGLLQPIADALKLMLKEDLIPADSDRALFWLAPVVSALTAMTSLSVLPFTHNLRVTDLNIGLLIITAMSAVGILGIVLGGWASNSHYPLLGALRSGAQLVSYEVALALALLSGVMAAGTLSMVKIVEAQEQSGVWFVFDNYGFMVVPFMVFLIAAIAETNRAPFDLPEAESELVAGFHTEYSGFRWALFFLAEYVSMFVISAVAVTLFWGGWLRPFPSVEWLELPLNYGFPILLFAGSGLACLPLIRRLKSRSQQVVLIAVALILIFLALPFAVPAINQAIIGLFWFLLKVWGLLYLLIWLRATFPRFRYDQLMDVGWKYLIPIGMGAILVNGVLGILKAR